MKKLDERSQWEQEWANAFQNEKQTPPDNVWKNLDAVLANKEAGKYKKRAAFYMWMAAASVLFSILGAAYFFLNSSSSAPQKQFSENVKVQPAPDVNVQQESRNAADTGMQISEAGETPSAGGSSSAGFPAEAGSQSPANAGGVAQNRKESGAAASAAAIASAESRNSPRKSSHNKSSSVAESDSGGTELVSQDSGPVVPAREEEDKRMITFSEEAVEEEVDRFLGESRYEQKEAFAFVQGKGFMEEPVEGEVKASIRKVWLASAMLKNKKERADARFWLGATMASNLFDPNYKDDSPVMSAVASAESFQPRIGALSSTARVDEWDENKETPVTITGGIQAAAWISKKWVLQTGIQYGSYKSEARAGAYVDPGSTQIYPLHYSNFSADKVQTSRTAAGFRSIERVSATNTFEFISVPLRIGYVLLDRKISLLLSPGVSTEFFLSNRLSDDENRLSTYTVYGGEDSPFNRIHLRGIVGVQLFYKIGENYLISLEPGYQQSITAFSKSDSYFSSSPSNLSLAAGFRYIIR